MLTDAAIQRALRTGMTTQMSDGSGRGKGRLIILIRSGRGEWYAQQWIAGKKRLKKIGAYPTMSLAEARRRYQSDYADVIEQKQDIRISVSPTSGTLADLLSGYVDWLKEAEKRSAHETEYNMKCVLEHLDGRMLARDVKTDHLNSVLRPIYARGSAGRADHLRSHIKSAFAWGIRADNDYRTDKPKRFMIDINPADAIPPEPKKAGSRYLSVDELRVFWKWLHDTTPYNPKAGHGMVESNLMCLRVLVLTGQRVEMISQLKHSQFDGEMLHWETTKTNVPHILPLPSQAIGIIEKRMEIGSKWMFPQTFNHEKHIGLELLQAITGRFCSRMGVYRFTPRDLRRTWKTLGGFAGLTKTERDLIQCHRPNDVSSRHYDRYEYLNEKRQAMTKWENWFRENIES